MWCSSKKPAMRSAGSGGDGPGAGRALLPSPAAGLWDDAQVRQLCFSVGLALFVATWASLLATFVLPRGRSAFLRPTGALLWRVHWLFVQLARPLRSYEAKDGLLAIAGPAAILIQLAAFLASFLLGLALMLTPWSASFLHALRSAAASLFSVGLARTIGRSNDGLVVLAAATGAITIALQIGYLPAIYQSFARRESLVTLTESRAGIPAWGPEVLLRHQLVSTIDALGDFYASFELWAADLAESHSTYPVLLLFRSPVAGYSWLLSLLAVLDAAALQLALFPSTAPSEARLCLRMGFSALRRIAKTLRWQFNHDPDPAGPLQLDYAAFASAAEQLVAAGYVIERPVEEAWPHFRGWRVNYEDLAYRLADLLVAPHVPWSGTRRYLPAAVVLPDRPPHRNPDGRTFSDMHFKKAP